MGAVALGVDVSLRRGLDVVALDSERRVVGAPLRKLATADLGALSAELRPAVVAIDSPPGPGLHGRSRQAERDLLRQGIHSYATPSDPERWARPFYAWMHEGQRAFAAVAAVGYRLYRGRGSVRRRALEVFPHATAVLLGGDAALPKGQRRRLVLEASGVDTTALRTLDQIDAALAALTGLLALEGGCEPVGDTREGVVVVPRLASRHNGAAPT